jgi:hypothetical protein
MSNSSKDRSSLCSFMFVDGRHCRIPRQLGHPYLCAFHARKEAQKLAGQEAGKDIAYHLSGSYVPLAISPPPWDASSPLSPKAK